MSNTKHTEGNAEISVQVNLAFTYPRYIRVKSLIICVAEGETPEISQANAERICKAWNCHDELVQSLENLVSWCIKFTPEYPTALLNAKQVLSKVNLKP